MRCVKQAGAHCLSTEHQETARCARFAIAANLALCCVTDCSNLEKAAAQT